MLFHTSEFAIFFLLLLPVYALARRIGRSAWLAVLLLFSQVFYAWWDWRFLLLLWVTILLDYLIALRLAQEGAPWRRRALLGLSIVASLMILAFFKYWNFLVGSAAALISRDVEAARIATLVLPVGISFYTFQSMSYVIDVYRGQEKPVDNLLSYATFVCFFPHMVAGPIMRIGRLLPMLLAPAPASVDRVLSGAALFSYGFLCKAVGDILASLHDPVFGNLTEAAPETVVFAVIGFGFQIYFDFNGYTSMARGVSRVLGVELMRNFRAPYMATSFRDFWKRWHIALSEWLRDYLYISLGGNRVRFPIRLRNLMVTMVLGGLWHGAGWSFLIWGGLHGTYLVVNTTWDQWIRWRGRPSGWQSTVRSLGGWGLTWLGVSYAWLYFRVSSFEDALVANQKIGAWLSAPVLPPVVWGAVAVTALLMIMDAWQRERDDMVPLGVPTVRHALVLGCASAAASILALALLAGAPTQQFIYFQF